MSLITEIGAAFSPREYPRLALVSTGRTIVVLLLMALVLAVALGLHAAGALGGLREAAGDWANRLPEMVLVDGRLSAGVAGPFLVEGPSGLFAVDTGNVLDLEAIASEYESFVVLRETEIVTGGGAQGLTWRPYPRADRPFTTEDFRLLVERTARFLPLLMLAGGLFVWAWLGLAQLLYATVFAGAAYLLTSGARPRPPYARLWRVAGHALVPVIALSALNALLRLGLGGDRAGLGWLGPGVAAVYCALGVNALLRSGAATPAGPSAGGPCPPGPGGGPDSGIRPPGSQAAPAPPAVA